MVITGAGDLPRFQWLEVARERCVESVSQREEQRQALARREPIRTIDETSPTDRIEKFYRKATARLGEINDRGVELSFRVERIGDHNECEKKTE